jgi:hypothetical protein
MLKRATPDLRKHFGHDQEMFDRFFNFSSIALDDMVMFYNTGKRHREAGSKKYSRQEFIHTHRDLDRNGELNKLPQNIYDLFVDSLYKPYCDGFNGIKR